MLLINENDMRWQDAAMANLQLKNILTNYHIGEGNVNCGVSRWPHGEAGKPHTHDAQDEIYISWKDAVTHAQARYEIVLENFKSGKYHAHNRQSDGAFHAISSYLAAVGRQQEKLKLRIE